MPEGDLHICAREVLASPLQTLQSWDGFLPWQIASLNATISVICEAHFLRALARSTLRSVTLDANMTRYAASQAVMQTLRDARQITLQFQCHLVPEGVKVATNAIICVQVSTSESEHATLGVQVRWASMARETQKLLEALFVEHSRFVFAGDVPDDERLRMRHVVQRGTVVRDGWKLQLQGMGWPTTRVSGAGGTKREVPNANMHVAMRCSDGVRAMLMCNVVTALMRCGLEACGCDDGNRFAFTDCGMSPTVSVRCGLYHWMQQQATTLSGTAASTLTGSFLHTMTGLLRGSLGGRAQEAPFLPSLSTGTSARRDVRAITYEWTE